MVISHGLNFHFPLHNIISCPEKNNWATCKHRSDQTCAWAGRPAGRAGPGPKNWLDKMGLVGSEFQRAGPKKV